MSDKEIHDICKKYDIENYTIKDGLVNVNSSVNLHSKGLTKLPLKFGKVSGNFDCSFNYLKSLDGVPLEVGKDFECAVNNLTSLRGSPIEVGGWFYCPHNKLTSLEGAPLKVGKKFQCHNNNKKLSYEKYLLRINRLNKIKLLDD